MLRQELSVIIITLNEADRIRRCLDSVQSIAQEIIVFDSGSKDGTLSIVREYTDKVYETDWPGFGKQKQRALDEASCDWVLSIDADEALDDTMREWIDEFLTSATAEASAVKLPWGVVAYGKLLNHGRSARAPLRLVKREGARFTDAEVHEELLPAPGKTLTAKGRLLHYSIRDYGHALGKNADYAWLGSQKYFRQGKRCSSLFYALLKSWWTFFHIYILRLGILDGRAGLLVALTYAQGNFNKYAGLWTLGREQEPGTPAGLP